MNLLPVPLKMNKLRGKLQLGDSLTCHVAKFHKSCKLKFGNEKLDKAVKKFEKQEKFGESSTSQAGGKNIKTGYERKFSHNVKISGHFCISF